MCVSANLLRFFACAGGVDYGIGRCGRRPRALYPVVASIGRVGNVAFAAVFANAAFAAARWQRRQSVGWCQLSAPDSNYSGNAVSATHSISCRPIPDEISSRCVVSDRVRTLPNLWFFWGRQHNAHCTSCLPRGASFAAACWVRADLVCSCGPGRGDGRRR